MSWIHRISRQARFVAAAAFLLLPVTRLEAETIDSIALRGHRLTLHLYGVRGSPPVVLSSGDGGWMHLGPHVAEVLAERGYFVVGFDAKAYLESFTSGTAALKPEDEPGDYRVLAEYAANGGTRKPVLAGVS